MSDTATDPAAHLRAAGVYEPVDAIVPTIIAAQQHAIARHPNAVFLRYVGDKQTWTWAQVDERAARIARSLASVGIEAGDRVGLLMGNRAEFYPVDLAALRIGAIPVSLYQTSAPEQIVNLAADAGIQIVFTEQQHVDRVLAAAVQLPNVKRVIVVDGVTSGKVTSLDDFVIESDDEPIPAVNDTQPDDLLTIVYTSGTTGPPKGAMVTNRNVITASIARRAVIGLPYGCNVISWMPAAHIAERVAGYYDPLLYGLVVTICPDGTKIAETLADVHPAWFFAPPRLWERLRSSIETEMLTSDDGFRQNLDAATELVWLQQRGAVVPAELEAHVAAADADYFAPLRTRLGFDAATACLTGSAPVPTDLMAFWNALGIPLAETYATTECCIGTLSPRDGIRFGSCGPAAPGVEIRLADDGEVLIKSDAVSRGYWRNPEQTAETFVDGWLHTGDIGTFSDDGYLSIIDRKKEIIINAAGKNMSPSNIEAAIKWADPLIAEVCVVGDGRPYNVALITLDPMYAPEWAKKRGLPHSVAELSAHPDLRAAIRDAVDRGNARLSRVESIKRFEVLTSAWLPGGDELTMTLKLKRRQIDAKYNELIDSIYGRAQ